MDQAYYNRVGGDRINSRQIDELIGIARGLAADGSLNQGEVEFLQKWLAANLDISDMPVTRVLYQRVNEILADGIADQDECSELLDTLERFSSGNFELGEVLKATTLPLCDPAPKLSFLGVSYCFTGTFNFGQRKFCEQAVLERGGNCGSLRKSTDVLVIGAYATSSWKHSSFGNKIVQACEWRDAGMPISIVSEKHWLSYL
jgi:NAD-dependent DNA ligase